MEGVRFSEGQALLQGGFTKVETFCVPYALSRNETWPSKRSDRRDRRVSRFINCSVRPDITPVAAYGACMGRLEAVVRTKAFPFHSKSVGSHADAGSFSAGGEKPPFASLSRNMRTHSLRSSSSNSHMGQSGEVSIACSIDQLRPDAVSPF